MGQAKSYSEDYKAQVVKLTKQIDTKSAAAELGVPYDTLSGWVRKMKAGEIDAELGEQTPETALTLAAEFQEL